MRITLNDQGALEVYPDNSFEARALLAWETLWAARTIHEGFIAPMKMRHAEALVIKPLKAGE